MPSTYVLMYNLGWVGHFHALIIPASVSVYNIFLRRRGWTARVSCGSSPLVLFYFFMQDQFAKAFANVSLK